VNDAAARIDRMREQPDPQRVDTPQSLLIHAMILRLALDPARPP
jgi:hypothetical protein